MGLHWINHIVFLAALCVLINIPVGLLLVLYNQQNGTSTVIRSMYCQDNKEQYLDKSFMFEMSSRID